MASTLHLSERALDEGVELSQIGEMAVPRGVLRRKLEMEGVMLFFFRSGEVDVARKAKPTLRGQPGDLLVLFPGEPLNLTVRTANAKFDYVVLRGVTPVRSTLRLGFWDGFKMSDGDSDGLPEAIVKMFEESPLRGKDDQVCALFEQYLNVRWRRIQEKATSPFFLTSIRVMQGLPMDHLTTERVAETLDVSRTKLNSMFLQTMGKRPGRYLKEMKVAVVREMLAETSSSVTRVAERAGFSSASALATFFQRETGILPSAYRPRRG
jgi:AraC-like DNA-binding protein